MLLHRQERHSHAVSAGTGEGESQAGALAGEKLVRNLNEDAGAVTSLGIAPGGPSVGKIDENLDAFADDVVAFLSAHVGDESDAAGIVLVARIVQSLGRRKAVRCRFHSWRFHVNFVQSRTELRFGRAHHSWASD